MLLGWGADVTVHRIVGTAYSVEVEFESAANKEKIYASTKETLRSEQWKKLVEKQKTWGDKWIMGGRILMILEGPKRRGGESKIFS